MENTKTFDLDMETTLLLDEFDTSLFNTSIELIDWFRRVYDFYNIFESVEISTHIYEELSKKGYKETKDSKEELEFLNAIIKKTSESPEAVGYKLISIIMRKLKNHERLDNTYKYFIDVFNEKNNSKKAYSQMMHKLVDHVDSGVVVMYVENGEQVLKTGTLDRVSEYKSITLNGVIIPFIGHKVAINKIVSMTGEQLYNNSNITSNYNLEDALEIEKISENTFGTQIRKEKKYL